MNAVTLSKSREIILAEIQDLIESGNYKKAILLVADDDIDIFRRSNPDEILESLEYALSVEGTSKEFELQFFETVLKSVEYPLTEEEIEDYLDQANSENPHYISGNKTLN